MAIEEHWQGPLADPVLTLGLPLPDGHPLNRLPTPPVRRVSPAPLAGNLTLHLHSVLNPDS